MASSNSSPKSLTKAHSKKSLKRSASGVVSRHTGGEVKSLHSTALGKSLLEVARGSIADYAATQPSFPIVLFVSRSLVPLGRESAAFVPKDSAVDQVLTGLYEAKGPHNYGSVFLLPADSTHPKHVFGAVVPRDILRRDETRQFVFGAIVNSLKTALLSDLVPSHEAKGLVIEAIDGNKVFGIPQAQIADTIADALIYTLLRYPVANTQVAFVSTSNSICELYIAAFKNKIEAQQGSVLADEDTSSDEERIRAYGNLQRQLYNSVGEVKRELYDLWVLLEKNFSQPKHPVLIQQLKYHLRDVHSATDSDLEAIEFRRKTEALQVVSKTFDKVQKNPVELFRELCSRKVVFAKEILSKALSDHHMITNYISTEEFNGLLSRYFGEDAVNSPASASAAKSKLSKSSPNPAKSMTRAHSRSVVVHSSSPKHDSGKRKSEGRPAKRSLADRDDDIVQTRLAGEVKLNDAQSKLLKVLYEGDGKSLETLIDAIDSADLDKLAASLSKIFWFGDRIGSLFRAGIKREVEKTTQGGTLFRLNSFATKIMTYFSKLVASEYLIQTLRPTVQRLKDLGNIEVDPAKQKDTNIVEQNRDKLIEVCTALVGDITKSIGLLPIECRQICAELQTQVGVKFPQHINVGLTNYLFLRLINPVISVPEAIGILPTSQVTQELRRGLLLLSKLFQNLANHVLFSKEAFMIPFNSFLESNFDRVTGFLADVATVPEDQVGTEHKVEVTAQTFADEVAIVSMFVKQPPVLAKLNAAPELVELAKSM